MTTPVVPASKMKAVVGLIGALLAAVVPLLVQISTSLPDPWPALIGGVIALLTMLGVYKTPFLPPGTAIVPTNPVVPPGPPAGGWTKPPGWK